MRKLRICSLICLVAIITPACFFRPPFYTQYFHPINTNELNLKGKNPKEVIDANVASVQGWELYLRSVSLYGSMHKENIQRQSYRFTIQAVSPRKTVPSAPLLIDTILVSIWPGDSALALPCQSVRVDSTSWKNQFRRIMAFGEMEFPSGKDTITVSFAARDSLSGQIYPFKIPMVRYQGVYKEQSVWRD